ASTVISACRRDTFSHCSNAAATSDSAGSRPRRTEVPAGTSTLPAGKLIRSTADEIRRPALLPETAFWDTVIGGGGSSAGTILGRLAPQVKQMRSSEPTSVAQSGQVRVTITARSSLDTEPRTALSYQSAPASPSVTIGTELPNQRHVHSLALVRMTPGSIAGVISFSLDDEHEALRRTVMEFAREAVAPVIGEFYERNEFPYEL